MAAIWMTTALALLTLACNQAPQKKSESPAPAPAATAAAPAAQALPEPALPFGSPTPAPTAPETSFLGQAPFSQIQLPPETHYVPPAAYVTQELVEKVGDSLVKGRVYRPDNPKGAVLIIHEWWGLNEPINQIAQEIAGWNYLTLAIDLYGGKVATNRGEAASLARGLDPKHSMATLKAAVRWLGESTTVTLPVGMVGWSWGGTLGLRLATEEPALKAVVVSDAQPLADPQSIQRIKAPVLAFFCMRGGSLTRQEVDAFTNDLMQLSSHKPQVLKFSTAPGTLLQPMNLQDEAYAKTARQRLREFLDKNLAAGK